MAETKGNYDTSYKLPYSHINIGIDCSHVGGKRGWYILNKRVPANAKSELPASASHTIAAELVGEYDLTPLHLAAYSGSEDVVRVLLNSSGVDVEGGCTPAVC